MCNSGVHEKERLHLKGMPSTKCSSLLRKELLPLIGTFFTEINFFRKKVLLKGIAVFTKIVVCL